MYRWIQVRTFHRCRHVTQITVSPFSVIYYSALSDAEQCYCLHKEHTILHMFIRSMYSAFKHSDKTACRVSRIRDFTEHGLTFSRKQVWVWVPVHPLNHCTLHTLTPPPLLTPPPPPPLWPASPQLLPGGPVAEPAHAQRHDDAPSPTIREAQEEGDNVYVRRYACHKQFSLRPYRSLVASELEFNNARCFSKPSSAEKLTAVQLMYVRTYVHRSASVIDLLLHTYMYIHEFSPKATTNLSKDVAMSLCYYFMAGYTDPCTHVCTYIRTYHSKLLIAVPT